MYRIDNASAVTTRPDPGPPGTPGYFSNGNPATAQEATVVDDWWANSIQEEILTVVEQAGLTPSKGSTSQLYEALNILFQPVGDLGETYLTSATYREWERVIRTAGSGTGYTVTYSIPPVLTDGMIHKIELHVANGALAELNVNAHGAKPIHYYSVGAWRPIPPLLLGADQQHEVAYHAGTDAYRLHDWKDTTGDWLPSGRSAARTGTILGLGQAVSRIDFAGLFAAYGITYGPGNGTTTFNLPDLRGRAVFGADQGAGRLSVAIAGTLGSVGGQEMQQYTVTGTAASAAVSVTGTIAGTANTNGKPVNGITGPANGTRSFDGGGNTGTPEFHTHNFTGTITGNCTVDGTFSGGGWTTAGTISGTTENKSNLPPGIVGNQLIVL
jgi:microcystin-dependent protein